MAEYIKKIKDSATGDIVYPQTKTEAVFDNNNRNLQVALTKRIVISGATPAEQVEGDLWYKELN